jgi:anhydro-N-acetylmuramic acid kinase
VLADKFFSCLCRKSLHRNAFAFANIGLPNFSVAGGAATRRWRPRRWRAWCHICQRHRAPGSWPAVARASDIGADAAERLKPASDAVGWSSQSLEVQAFAFLAVHTLDGLPLTFPTTTGVPQPMPGGIVARPRS